MRITEEQIERANSVNLPNFLMANGFELKKVGREYSWKEHDSLHIKDNEPGERGRWFRFSTDEGGDNISFVREYMGKSFVEAVEMLNGESYERDFVLSHNYERKPKEVKKADITILENTDSKRVFAYLCKTRGLDYNMISKFVKSGKIVQEQKTGNAVFKIFDEDNRLIGAEKVGTSTQQKFKGIATGSASGYGFEVCKGNGENAMFFESAIDMLSYLQMYGSQLDNHRLVSMMGVKPFVVIDTMKRFGIPPENVFICSDNDKAGNELFTRLQNEFPQIKRIFPDNRYKDWNDALRDIPKEKEEVGKVTTYGNKTWNDATDNRNKMLVSMNEDTFMKLKNQLHNSGINYFAYAKNESVVMAVNDKDIDWLKQLSGIENLPVRKSSVEYIPPQKNIIGNEEYRYISYKQYISADSDTALKMAEIMLSRNVQFSGRIYPNGKATLTVSGADLAHVKSIQQSVIDMRKQFAREAKADEIIGNKAYRDICQRQIYYSKLTPERYKEVQPYLDTNAEYSGLIRDNKVIFTVEKEDSAMFHRALENAQREVGIINTLKNNGIDDYHIEKLSAVIHRFAVEDIHESLDSFFTPQLDEKQFDKMLSLVNDYLAQAVSERYGEYSGLNAILDFKNEIDRISELTDFFSGHTFSDEQKNVITEMFVKDSSKTKIEVIDETFSPDEIREYYEILHNALQESDVADFLTAHKQAVIDRENAERVPTEEEALFPKADLAKFLAERSLSSDEWEDMAYPLFENGHLDKFKPNDKAILGYHLSEPAFYNLAHRYHNDEDIRRELAIGLMEHSKTDDIEFVFEDGKISDRTFYYAENLRHSLHTERTEDGCKCSFGGMERFVSFEEIGQAFIDRTHEEFDDLMYWRILDYIKDDIPDITDETVQQLITAFDDASRPDWSDNLQKRRQIKRALYDILGNDDHTEKAFACIAKHKYNVEFNDPETRETIHFGLLGNGITAYDVSRTDKETNDYPTVAHISPEGVVRIYDDSLSAEDIERINEQAQSAREKFMTDWNKLTPEQQFQKLLDRADISTTVNINRKKLSMEQKVEKYMPFVFFGEGERPEPELEPQQEFTIYQMKSGEEYHYNRFESLENNKGKINIDDYDVVYSGFMDEYQGNTLDDKLENIYAEFNTNLPDNFFGHSLSMSDVIVTDDKAYYADTIGFAEFPEFFREKEVQLSKAEQEKTVNSVGRGPVTLYKVGDFYELYGKDARSAAEVLDLHLTRKNDNDMVGFLNHVKGEYCAKLREAGFTVLEAQTFELNPLKRDRLVPLDKAKYLINSFCEEEYRDGADFSDLHNVGLAYTTMTDDELPVQVTADLIDFKITYEFDGEVFNTEQYDSIEDMVENGLTGLDFNDLVSVPDDIIEKHTDKNEQTIDLMSDTSKVGDISSPADVSPVTLEYKGDTESIVDIKDKALSLGAVVTVDNAEGTISISTYENHKDELDSIAHELGLMVVVDETVDIDKPLFADTSAIEEIQRNERSDTTFLETPDVHGEQLTLFGDSVPLIAKEMLKQDKKIFAEGLFVGDVNRFTALHNEIMRGTGFQNGKFRVKQFYDEKKPINKEFANFLKNEYGTGGHSGDGEIRFVDHDSKGMFFTLNSGEKFKFTWSDVAEMTSAIIDKSEYITQTDIDRRIQNAKYTVEHTAPDSPLEYEHREFENAHKILQEYGVETKNAVAEPVESDKTTIEVGDKFKNKLTGEISEVISLTGALPWYTDDCTVRRESGGFAITENIPYSKLFDDSLYEYIGKNDVAEKTDISEKTEMSINTPTHDSDIPVYKGEWKIADNKELYKDIVTENECFAEMAKSIIGNGKNPADNVKALTEKFGFERTAWLTALNIVAHPLDGRFYPMDKVWACKVLAPHFEIQPDELFRHDTEKSSTFDRLISGGTLYDIHNTHLAQFAETFIPEYEKYLEKAVAVENPKISEKAGVSSEKSTVLSNSPTHDKDIHALSDDDKQFLADYPQIPMPTYSPWGAVQECTEIAHGVFEVSTAGHGGIMIADDLVEHILSDKARKIGFVEDGWHCFEEDADAQVPLRELLDKGIMDKEKYFAETYRSTFEEKGEWFNKVINDSISTFHPDYWSAYMAEQAVTAENVAEREDILELEKNTSLPDALDMTDLVDNKSEIEQISKNSANFTITDDSLGNGGAKTKFRANVEAIKTLKILEKENRSANDSEKEILSKYVGWGGIPQAFDSENKAWSSEFSELKELLTGKEYSSARVSTLDAFYTTPIVIDGIYQALESFGFEGGNVLEPAMGVGNFFGRMPENMRADSKLYGVEIDDISGRIAKQIYPDADIAIKGFEHNNFQNGCFDVVVGNVPFGELSFKDDKHQTTKLHDYFFAESLEKVKNGGIIAFVTSAGTLDKKSESVRKNLAEKADFIGAIRLPNIAFKQNANTEVTTDIIFLQKKENKNSAEIPDWVHIGQTADGLPINKYLELNPEMVLGKIVEGNKMYNGRNDGTTCIPLENADLKEQLKIAVSKLSATISDEKAKDVYAKSAEGKIIEIPSNLRNYSFFEQDNKIYFKTSKSACYCRFDTKNSQFKRAKAFINLRDLTRELIEAQELDKPDEVIKDLQAKMNTAYDDFYKKYGLIHSQSNKRYFSDDISYNLVAGLEKKYDKTKLVEKSDIFFKRTIQPPTAVEHVETAIEALTLSVAEKAKVDFEYMSSLTGMTENELKHDLQGEIYKVPHTENDYQTASEYLSGDIRVKLKIAQEVAEYDGDFAVNVNALKNAMPTPLMAGDIDVKIGATWLAPKYYEQFMYETFSTPKENRADVQHFSWQRSKLITAEYSEHSGTWHIDNKSHDRSVIAMQQFGTKKMGAYEIMEHLLNLKEPKIYKTIEVPDPEHWGETKEKRVVDVDATKVVQRKADKIRESFKKWIFKDPARREEIVGKYNELFNSIRPREFDGSALKFSMMNADITLHEHQKNAVAHAMFGGNTLFAHSVGAGKTFEMIATAMESKRLGLCTKSLFAVPNHLTEQIGDDFQKLYPGANILVATKKDFQKENRQQLFAKIATGNFDAVIIGHSQLGMIPISKERQEAEIQAQINDIIGGIAELKHQEGSKFQIKAMERTKKSLKKQLDKLNKNHDDTITFEQLGVDKLFVDEAHEFKNLFCPTKMNNVSGISNSASQKALDLYLKCRYLDEKTDGKGITFATGTPNAAPYHH